MYHDNDKYNESNNTYQFPNQSRRQNKSKNRITELNSMSITSYVEAASSDFHYNQMLSLKFESSYNSKIYSLVSEYN